MGIAPVRPRGRIARLGMLLLPSIIVLLCVGITAAIAVSVQEHSIRAATTERVVDVATHLAELDQVRDAVVRDRETATTELQPLTDVVQRAAGVDYVVITDAAGIRITHPTPSERGKPVSTDPSRALAGETYVDTEEGTRGLTLRAKTPILDSSGEVIGILSVGILEARISEDFGEAVADLLPWIIGALLVGTLANTLVSAAIRRRFRGADEMTREMEHQRSTTALLREQTHEFRTRLHVLHGLVSHGDSAEALRYIEEIAPVQTATADDGVDMHPLIRAVTEALRSELADLGTSFSADVDLRTPPDDDLMLVVTNLCRNAGEAGASRVRLHLVETEHSVHGTVDDDGTGIDPTQRSQVFSLGFSSKPDRSGAGRGIGLNLVRRLVTDRGGTVEIGESSLGGARFSFEMRMPAWSASAEEQR